MLHGAEKGGRALGERGEWASTAHRRTSRARRCCCTFRARRARWRRPEVSRRSGVRPTRLRFLKQHTGDVSPKFTVVALAAAALAAPQPQIKNVGQDLSGEQYSRIDRPEIRILSQKFVQDIYGNYEYSYEQDNGQQVEEVGRVEAGPEPNTGSISKQGGFQFVADDGQTYQVSYVADEGGFQPQGAHLPQPPAQIPEYEQLRRDYPELFWAENGGAVVGL